MPFWSLLHNYTATFPKNESDDLQHQNGYRKLLTDLRPAFPSVLPHGAYTLTSTQKSSPKIRDERRRLRLKLNRLARYTQYTVLCFVTIIGINCGSRNHILVYRSLMNPCFTFTIFASLCVAMLYCDATFAVPRDLYKFLYFRCK